jgi:ribosomal protein S25
MPQKKSLKKIEKQQRMREEKGKPGKARFERSIGSMELPDISSEELLEQLDRMKAITPTGLAAQLDLKVSAAKRLLEELRANKVVDLATRSHNLKVYSLSED